MVDGLPWLQGDRKLRYCDWFVENAWLDAEEVEGEEGNAVVAV